VPTPEYVDILSLHFASRRERNPRYSLRAFARDLGVAPSTLSEVMAGKSLLSRMTAHKIGTRLGLAGPDLELLCDAADAAHPRSAMIRTRARRRLARRPRLSTGRWRVVRDELAFVTSWKHIAIMEMLDLDGPPPTLARVRERLRMDPVAWEQTLGQLERLGLVRIAGDRLEKTDTNFTTTHDVPSEAIRRLHDQLLAKARSTLHSEPVERRLFNSLILAVPSKRLPAVAQRLRELCRELNDQMATEAGTDEVYCLGVQFFPLLSAPEPPRPEPPASPRTTAPSEHC
jgi:uncharacterized protein (TIGR02147 family)